MTRKTGKVALRARQQTRAAKLARYKRDLSAAGVSMSLPKPTSKARKAKEEELKKLYLELCPPKKEEAKQTEQQPEESEGQAQEEEQAKQEETEGSENTQE